MSAIYPERDLRIRPGRLLAEAMAAYLSVGWALRVGGSVATPVVMGADKALTPMDSRPVGQALGVVLARTSSAFLLLNWSFILHLYHFI